MKKYFKIAFTIICLFSLTGSELFELSNLSSSKAIECEVLAENAGENETQETSETEEESEFIQLIINPNQVALEQLLAFNKFNEMLLGSHSTEIPSPPPDSL